MQTDGWSWLCHLHVVSLMAVHVAMYLTTHIAHTHAFGHGLAIVRITTLAALRLITLAGLHVVRLAGFRAPFQVVNRLMPHFSLHA